MLPDRIIATSVGFSELLIVISFGLLVERLKPRNAEPSNSVRLNLAYALVEMLAQTIIMPVFSLATVLAVNAAGGGWIVMSTQGWALVPAFLLYTLTVDFHEYLFHRAQHRLPVLWAMHSLHHSDTALNASTTTRHYWAEQF
ncbi:MAG TPA: sterol desaturase family protein, partial [Bryobacteraceae bacterium]